MIIRSDWVGKIFLHFWILYIQNKNFTKSLIFFDWSIFLLTQKQTITFQLKKLSLDSKILANLQPLRRSVSMLSNFDSNISSVWIFQCFSFTKKKERKKKKKKKKKKEKRKKKKKDYLQLFRFLFFYLKYMGVETNYSVNNFLFNSVFFIPGQPNS